MLSKKRGVVFIRANPHPDVCCLQELIKFNELMRRFRVKPNRYFITNKSDYSWQKPKKETKLKYITKAPFRTDNNSIRQKGANPWNASWAAAWEFLDSTTV